MRLTLEMDWRKPSQVFGVLLGARVREFLGACAAAGLCLIQIEPFVPFPTGPRGPVAVTLVGVAVPHEDYDKGKGPKKWSDIECLEVRDKYHGPAFKTRCTKFPNPKIFVDVVSCGQMYGFGAYIEWLRATCRGESKKPAHTEAQREAQRKAQREAQRKAQRKALTHLAAFLWLMWRVFRSNTLVRVHNTDVPYFHIKKAGAGRAQRGRAERSEECEVVKSSD